MLPAYSNYNLLMVAVLVPISLWKRTPLVLFLTALPLFVLLGAHSLFWLLALVLTPMTNNKAFMLSIIPQVIIIIVLAIIARFPIGELLFLLAIVAQFVLVYLDNNKHISLAPKKGALRLNSNEFLYCQQHILNNVPLHNCKTKSGHTVASNRVKATFREAMQTNNLKDKDGNYNFNEFVFQIKLGNYVIDDRK